VIKLAFIDLNIKREYRSLNDDIVKTFYIPILSRSKSYKRAVGFFSSTALVKMTPGLEQLVENGGKIQLIASPRLSKEDIFAIKEGYERRKVVEKVVLNSLKKPQDKFEEERLNLLANLISDGYLDIKIAYIKNNTIGMFHEKMGLMEDEDSNKIAFSGSMNESENGFTRNYETIDVFTTWSGDKERVQDKEIAFNKAWLNQDEKIEVYQFESVSDKLKGEYYKNPLYLKPKDPLPVKVKETDPEDYLAKKNPKIPKDVTFYDYQEQAIKNWALNGYCGIFDMATGTGKTYTALGAIVHLSKELNGKLGIIIVCPFQHLVEQWVEDIKKFNIYPIIGYSSSRQKKWKEHFKQAIRSFQLGLQDNFCFVTTNQTFRSKYIQDLVSKLNKNLLLVVDEAHNFGASYLSKTLEQNEQIPYRLALTATLERYFDEEGTQKLINFFGKKCIKYDLKHAIEEKKLVKYYYYPILVTLTREEYLNYQDLSELIKKEVYSDHNQKVKLTEKGKMLAIKRAQIVAGAKNKVDALIEAMEAYKDKHHILVYCGTSKTNYENEYSIDEDEQRQIDYITKKLNEKLNMRVSQFTSRENMKERTKLKKQFEEGEKLQALIAIKCLDEGVNIPSIKVAFILASTSNPKEYIQRRGRVLRLSENKEYAIIFDFVTLPKSVNEIEKDDDEEKLLQCSLVKSELKRIIEFKKLAENEIDSDVIIKDIDGVYGSILNEFWEEIDG